MKKHRRGTWKFQIFLATLLWSLFSAGAVDYKAPFWQEFVVGKLSEIPNANIREYLQESHFENPYAETIRDLTAMLGPFSPDEDNVFWLPHLEVPVDANEWRFLSTSTTVPDNLKRLIYVRNGNQYFIKMFVHPFSLEAKAFKELAARFGGYKYEFQAATTASTRSFVAWKCDQNLSFKDKKLCFPKDTKDVIKTKVSIYNTDINGSRLNHPKKMVRAMLVSQLMSQITEDAKGDNAFIFEGEHIVAVPDHTSAGYVVRETSPELLGQIANRRVEPAFATLSPARLSEMTKGQNNAFEWIRENLFKPVAKHMMYLLLEQGAMGENHTQNIGYVLNGEDRPTGKLSIHDSDAFRVSVMLRALNGKSMENMADVDDPIYYLKDSTFTATQKLSGDDAMTLNSLLDYAADNSSVKDWNWVMSVYNWCRNTSQHMNKEWCNRNYIRRHLLMDMAEEASGYLDREVDWKELNFTSDHLGTVGLISIFKERLKLLAKRMSDKAVVPQEFQERLASAFERLNAKNFAKTIGDRSKINTQEANFHLVVNDNSVMIVVLRRVSNADSNPLLGVALIGEHSDARTKALVRDMLGHKKSQELFHEMSDRCKRLLHPATFVTPKSIQRGMGGEISRKSG